MARKKDVTQNVDTKTELSSKPEPKVRAKSSKPPAEKPEKLSASRSGSASKSVSAEKVRSTASAKSNSAKSGPGKNGAAKKVMEKPSPAATMRTGQNGGGELKREKLSDYESAFRPITVDLIAERAWMIWQEEGCPDGQDLQHWLRAERELSRSS